MHVQPEWTNTDK